jgi:hypothetical protein
MMTLQEAKAIARHLGFTLRKVHSGDYRVGGRDGGITGRDRGTAGGLAELRILIALKAVRRVRRGAPAKDVTAYVA